MPAVAPARWNCLHVRADMHGELHLYSTCAGQRMGAIVITDGSGNVQATEYISGIGTGPQAVFAPGIISTVAGNGIRSYNGDGIARDCRGALSWGVAVDSVGNIYIADDQQQPHSEGERQHGH